VVQGAVKRTEESPAIGAAIRIGQLRGGIVETLVAPRIIGGQQGKVLFHQEGSFMSNLARTS
jgi:hypothetical protein